MAACSVNCVWRRSVSSLFVEFCDSLYCVVDDDDDDDELMLNVLRYQLTY